MTRICWSQAQATGHVQATACPSPIDSITTLPRRPVRTATGSRRPDETTPITLFPSAAPARAVRGTYRSACCPLDPSDNRGRERFDPRHRSGELLEVRPAVGRRIITAPRRRGVTPIGFADVLTDGIDGYSAVADGDRAAVSPRCPRIWATIRCIRCSRLPALAGSGAGRQQHNMSEVRGRDDGPGTLGQAVRGRRPCGQITDKSANRPSRHDEAPGRSIDLPGASRVVERGVDPRTPRFSGVCSAD